MQLYSKFLIFLYVFNSFKKLIVFTFEKIFKFLLQFSKFSKIFTIFERILSVFFHFFNDCDILLSNARNCSTSERVRLLIFLSEILSILKIILDRNSNRSNADREFFNRRYFWPS